MSSEYIPRLRAELVRAAEQRQPRRLRLPSLRPLVPAAAVALAIVAVLVVLGRDGGEQSITYGVAAAAGEQAADVMRERLAAFGVPDATVSLDGAGRLVIDAPPEQSAQVAALTRPGRLALYDWETSVLGADGRPAPADDAVTGGEEAAFGVAQTRAEAERRAALSPGAIVAGAPDGSGWFALGGEPALTEAAVAGAEPADGPGPAEGGAEEAVVAVELTPAGAAAFEALTRDIVQRGTPQGPFGHFAIVLDDRIVSVPYLDHRVVPDGIEGADGVQIAGGLDDESARRIAVMLDSGPLPAELLPESGG